MAYLALEKLINMHDGYRKVFRVDGRELLLLQESGEPHLVLRACPHAAMPLDTAVVNGDELTCPWHLMRFSLSTGVASHPDCPSLEIVPLAYEGNTLGVDLSRYLAS